MELRKCWINTNAYNPFVPVLAVTSFPSPAGWHIAYPSSSLLENWPWRHSAKMFARNESRTGEFCEVEIGGNHDTMITNDLFFEFMLDLLDMQNTVFCSSGYEPFRLWGPLRTFERLLLREYVKDNNKVMNSATILNEFTFIFHHEFNSRSQTRACGARLAAKLCEFAELLE